MDDILYLLLIVYIKFIDANRVGLGGSSFLEFLNPLPPKKKTNDLTT